MGKRDPEDEQRRQIVRGGLLAAAAALGFLPGCSADAEAASGDGSPNDAGSPGAAGARAGAPAADGGQAAPSMSAARADAASAGRAGSGGESGTAADAGVASGGSAAAGTTAGGAGAPASAAGSGGSMQPMASATGLPRAMLGKTGVSVPIVGLGTSRLGQRGGTPNQADFDNMVQVFTKALDLGVEYVDTGAAYGRAEEALGKVLAGRRDKVFLATKLFTNTYAQAQQLFERSLERLGTDHVDLLHLHSVGQRDIDTVLSQEGAWRFILEQKAMGRARFVGITGHNNPANFMRMLATDEVDVMMTIMNFVDHSTYGFSKTVREEALARGVGVMAMKVFGGTESVLRPGGGLANADSPVPLPSNMQIAFDETVLPECMRFVKSLGGITGMVIGINTLEEIENNIRWATETQPFSDTEMQAIIRMGETIAPMWAERYG
jgi:predicted aldo/keto reductase-like oxidoreductase